LRVDVSTCSVGLWACDCVWVKLFHNGHIQHTRVWTMLLEKYNLEWIHLAQDQTDETLRRPITTTATDLRRCFLVYIQTSTECGKQFSNERKQLLITVNQRIHNFVHVF
jgi:hypothetical protein